MALVSVTRLRLRSLRFLPAFVWAAQRSSRQALASAGNLGVITRKTRGLSFWTLSVWSDEKAMAAFRAASPHREAMAKLAHWCDEGAVAHWQQDGKAMPDWTDAAAQLAALGRLLRVDQPSAEQRAGRINTD